MFNTGIFATDCREWNKRAADVKTLPHLKVFFTAAHREWCLSLQNETVTPYGAAHNATAHNATPHPDDGYLQKETVDDIANLATATASDRAAIAQLTATVERLTAELITVESKIVTDLQPQCASRGGCGGQSRGRGCGAGTTTPTGAVSATRTKEQDLEPTIHYCWTCGPVAGTIVQSAPPPRLVTSTRIPSGTCRAGRKPQNDTEGLKQL